MIDNFKCYLNNKNGFEQSVSKNADIDLKAYVSTITGEVSEYPKIGKYYNLEARITEKKATLKGSLHKFINSYFGDEEQNYNDFDIRDVNLAIEGIASALEFNPLETKVTNLEFGFNIETDEDPQIIIDNRLLMFGFKNHNRDNKFQGRGDFKQYDMSDYSIKIYNKSKQYGQEKHILRVEIKFTMSRKLVTLGVRTLNDLTNPNLIKKLFDCLMQQFEKLIIVDAFYNRDDISERDKARLNMFTNPYYWVNAAETKLPNVRERLIRECKKLIKKYNLDRTKREISKKIQDKFLELMRVQLQQL